MESQEEKGESPMKTVLQALFAVGALLVVSFVHYALTSPKKASTPAPKKVTPSPVPRAKREVPPPVPKPHIKQTHFFINGQWIPAQS